MAVHPEQAAVGGLRPVPWQQRISEASRHKELHEWCRELRLLPPEITEYRRLQLEHWLWQQRRRPQLQGLVVDVGQPFFPRYWVPGSYVTLGPAGCDVQHDICEPLPIQGGIDCIICCEVLEHVDDPFAAVRNLRAALKPGGLLLASSPFLWPYHGQPDVEGDPFPDYWRFTAEGWRLLLQDFAAVDVRAAEWTAEGRELMELAAVWEVWTSLPADLGYFVEAIR